MFQRYITLFAASLLAVVFAGLIGCTPGGKVSDTEIAASWDDTAMTVRDFKDKMVVRYSNESSAMKREYADRVNVLDEYVVRALKIAEGYRLKFHEREDIRKAYNDAMESKASEMLYDQKVLDAFVTDQMLKDFFKQDLYEVHCRHILIAMDENVKGKDTLAYWEKINEVYQKAKAGEDFRKLVTRYSEDTSIDRELYGDLGFFKWGKMVDEFQEAAWKLEPGETSPPVRTRYGYHIIQMLEKRSTGMEVKTSNILVKVSRRAAPAETSLAWDRTMEILKEAKKRGADFAQLARRYSEDEKSWVNGEIGWVPKGNMPSEYWDKALTMKEGEIDGPVRTYKGYHIIKVHEFRDVPKSLDDPETMKDVKGKISRVYRDSMKVISDKYLASVKNRFGMRYNEPVVTLLLRKLNDKSAPQNMNLFSSFTPQERELAVVLDNLDSLKIQNLVDQFGDHRFPPQFENTHLWVEQLVEPVLMPKYLAAIAKEEGLMNNPVVLEEGKKALENAILPEVEQEMVFSKATPTPEEVRKYYDGHLAEFTEAPTATIYEIMVDDKQLAQDLRTRIDKGEDIARLAKRYTQRDKSKRSDGKLGPFTLDQYGPVSRKAFELKVGDVAGPIEAGDLYSVMKLIETTPEKVKPFEEVSSQIEGNIRFEGQKTLKDDWIAELKKFYNLKYNEAVLKRVWPIIEPLSEELVDQRKEWRKEREEAAKRGVKAGGDDKIKLQLKPNSEQEYTTKDGKKVQVKIGEPRYVDKEGKEIAPDKAKITLTPKGKIERKEGSDKKNQAPTIKLKPGKKSTDKD